jgi:hypothetical protein
MMGTWKAALPYWNKSPRTPLGLGGLTLTIGPGLLGVLAKGFHWLN